MSKIAGALKDIGPVINADRKARAAPKGYRYRQAPDWTRSKKDPEFENILDDKGPGFFDDKTQNQAKRFLDIDDEDLLLEAIPGSEARRATDRASKATGLKRRALSSAGGRVARPGVGGGGGSKVRRKTLLSGNPR